jgi:hypothetical protein
MTLTPEQMEFAEDTFVPVCLMGKVDQQVFSAFLMILEHCEVADPRSKIQHWIDNTKQKVANELNLPLPEVEFLQVDLDMTRTPMTLEAAFLALWRVLRSVEEIRGCLLLRRLMIAMLGWQRQSELIGEWNRDDEGEQNPAENEVEQNQENDTRPPGCL